MRHLTVTTRGRDGCAVISLRGELDIASADDLRRGLHAARRAHGDHLILDLDHLEFMDSHGLSVIVNCHKAVTGHGSLALTGARPIVRRTLQITGLDRRLTLYDTVEQATASLHPPAVQAAPSRNSPAGAAPA
ncbi:stage II sporulation protein AA (anti-sigma F factor antagonist) [Thermomonospora echinospora]|uniref:Anti-sigma factor antagonist n=1 Tax=Thermomonospora echinospora TaxID=1992 RepID=A0A1H5X6W2_9ACTN|nr:anti-sigma factor antagonist [Thermomonospora echinospora]SEG07481.1 stage II sporulation protein AA (anti-sigma F factor antagonist) [Thermomonospora echinospora]